MDKQQFKNEFYKEFINGFNHNNIKSQQNFVSFKKETVLTNLSYLNSNLNNSKSLIQLEPIVMTLNKRNHDIFFKSSFSETQDIKNEQFSKVLNSKYWSLSFHEFDNLKLKALYPNSNKQNKNKTMLEGNIFIL